MSNDELTNRDYEEARKIIKNSLGNTVGNYDQITISEYNSLSHWKDKVELPEEGELFRFADSIDPEIGKLVPTLKARYNNEVIEMHVKLFWIVS